MSETVPGIVVAHSPASSRAYIGSPSLVVLPDGAYVSSHDFFGPGTNNNQTVVFRSTDRGRTWITAASIIGQFWSNLFVHRGMLYLMGVDKEYGRMTIRRSNDGGINWTVPTNNANGVLRDDQEYHTAPVPVVEHNGRLWRAFEDRNPPALWGVNFRVLAISARSDADLLRADSWITTNRLRYNPLWGGDAWLEGNVVVLANGDIVDILRTDCGQRERAAVVRISSDGLSASFDPMTGLIGMPGSSVKFTIRFDAESNRYWAITNALSPDHPHEDFGSIRNNQSLISSRDTVAWDVNRILLSNPDYTLVGFQYVDWQFDGDDIVFVSRTSFPDGLGGAHTYHDANYLTFHRIERFRSVAGSP
jgi:hypothetical protein